ncbi:cobyrinate a,c-diamide synthase [Lacrimispora sp. 210928-DFI.3.58]|uniref:cobyrinate a,c-diamide synthase n=1 Tax=Lacrimispora sp. 210928-DFI.3.58 TaxID=2883214 RepID=UPI0015B6D6F8|nr:cobyrinate a,c-diamide synthase [Lacrimispora sp. 210928-DFI.3.58]MCB7319823.1 cobyrinate a,c-diamide synthase [Lacrimispora sp. 210928-DFI.3.58]
MAGFLIAAPKSGSGKTMVTCGILEVLKRRGKRPWAFKCGPDYIDGLFHRQVLQVEGGNLDSFFETEEHLRRKYRRAEAEHFVVAEGVMGYFDGLGGTLPDASSWEIADILRIPVVLVLDAKGASLSLVAQIKGFLDYEAKLGRGERHIAAVIFNRMSAGMYPRMKEITEGELGILAAGYVPELDFLKVGSRHLGLILPDEVEGLKMQMEQLGDCLEETLDWEILESLSGPSLSFGEDVSHSVSESSLYAAKRGRFRLGVAWDEAFCFYYRDNLEEMEAVGAEIVYFSPLHEDKLPEGLDGLLIGGGYPENYAAELSENTAMRQAVALAAAQGMPILAECGGYLYLLEELEGLDGVFYPMTGIFEGKGCRKGKNSRFGYVALAAEQDTPYLLRGEEIKGHEFHYWDCRTADSSWQMRAVKPVGKRTWPCMRVCGQVMAGFPHLYYPSAPAFVERFSRACRRFGVTVRRTAAF